MLRSTVLIVFVLSFLIMPARAWCAPSILGWQELARVLPGDPVVEASLDTINEWGSLHVQSYRRIVITKAPNGEKQPAPLAPTSEAPRSPTVVITRPPDAPPSPKENLNRKVKFSLSDRFGHTYDYELPVLRSIKVKSANGKTEIRPVVPLTICIGNLKIDGEFSLRRDLEQSNHIRIGRRDLAGKGLVDPGRSFTLQPSCN